MSTISPSFVFGTSAEGFVGTAGVDSTLSYDAAVGNPAGALKSRIYGRNKVNTNNWDWSGTWEDLGVPAGATVTHIRVNAGYTRCTEYNVGDSGAIGPYTLRDSGGTLQATLWAGRTATGTDAAWQEIAAQADQAVPEGLQASGSSIRLRLANTLDNGNNAAAAISVYDDQITFVITYTQLQAIEGSGSVSITIPALSGLSLLQFVGLGGISLTAPSLTGAAVYVPAAITAEGGVLLGAPGLSGQGLYIPPEVVGAGGVVLLPPSLAGNMTLGAGDIEGSGGVAVGPPALEGLATLEFRGAGGVALAGPVLEGTAAYTPPARVASGGVTIDAPSLAGTAVYIPVAIVASGGVELAKPVLAGVLRIGKPSKSRRPMYTLSLGRAQRLSIGNGPE